MKINDGPTLQKLEIDERLNLSGYLDGLAQWSYVFTKNGKRNIISRLSSKYTVKGDTPIDKKDISSDEIGILALACRKYKSTFPTNNILAEQEFVDYQYQLQGYLGMNDPKVMIQFYTELISNIKPEHNKLIPVLHSYHTQIHALKIAYDALKGNISKSSITSRVIFGLICIEFMTLGVRLYLIEPLARTTEGKDLDWIYMLDKIFDDFSFTKDQNRESLRRKNLVDINKYQELGLMEMMTYIKQIRDEIDLLKRQKLGTPEERKPKDPIPPINPTGYVRTIRTIQGRIKKQIP
ncbi:hypothetical protein K2X92_02720 [Candidatus Gracilibacteria bacterium]|nr:hypothetical protein [Candidatus Gracilibacteria bacterium]